MSDFSDLGGLRVVSGSICIPYYGLWSGDVMVSNDSPIIPTLSTLTIGNLSLACSVRRSSAFAGVQKLRIVAGYGGWRTEIPFKQYQNRFGINASLVLNDVAMEVGEKVNVPNDFSVGNDYVRGNPSGLIIASQVLRNLAGQEWYCDPTGVTQLASWPSTTVATPFTVIDQDGGRGIIEIATEDYVSWLPGCQFTSPTLNNTYTNYGVVMTFDDAGIFRMSVLTR